MNRLSILLGFLLFSTAAFSQITVSVTGMVTDVMGEGVGGVNIIVTTDSLNFNFEYYNTVITNEDGSYSDSFDVPENLTQGGVIVIMENCDNSFQAETAYWNPGNDPVVDFVYCNVNCSVSISETNTGTLEATATGVSPFTYEWNVGGTTPVITPSVDGYYCATIIDAVGCTSNICYYYQSPIIDSFCFVNIYLDSTNTGGLQLTAYPEGNAPFTYYWDNGASTQSIGVVPIGSYCLSVTDATGCVSASCFDFGGGCDEQVYIYQNGDNLSAAANIVGDVYYEWNTGETTSNILGTDEGDYCVTVTYGEGCLTSDCYYFYPDTTNVDSCWVFIDVVQNGAWLSATGGGTAPFTYEWSTGETVSAIEMLGDTLYCVTVTDAEGCTAINCHDNFVAPLNISGYVFDGIDSVLAVTGIVNLYDVSTNGMSLIATATLDNHSYFFPDLPQGEYIVQAIADDYLPTYHYNSLWWDEADVISLSLFNQYAPIELVPLVDGFAEGNGEITGTVTDPDEFTGHGSGSRDFTPIEGAEIVLFNDNNEPIAFMFTDAEGSYSFDNLPYGTYTVYFEMFGLDQVYYTVTIGPDTELVENIDFVVDGNSVTANKPAVLEEGLLSVYPNPVKAELNISLDLELKGEAIIELININGQLMQTNVLRAYQQQQSINVSSLNAGLHILKVTTDEGIIVQQFVKE